MPDKPRIFIASSSEQFQVAQQVEAAMASPDEWSIHVWNTLFSFNATYVESLERELDRADFAIVILTGDDAANVRHKSTVLPRDNVIFELGLFIGRLGRPRCFFFVDAKSETQIASDLSGVKPVKYYPEADAQNEQRPSLQTQAGHVMEQIRQFGDLGIRYKPAPEERSQQEALWRFSSRVAGQWWERIRKGEDQQSALSYLTISVDPASNTPRLDGKSYSLKDNSLADWKSVVSGVVPGKKPKIFYRWEGEHEASIGQTYGGHGVITFDDEKLETAEGHFFDTNFAQITEGAMTRVKHFRLYRCSAEDVETMQKPFSDKAQALIKKRLKSLQG